jgi:hypothetical protein
MLRTTAHEQLRRTNPAKGYVAGRCNASTVAVTSDLGARPDKARLLHPPLWDLRSRHSPIGEMLRLCRRRVAGVHI